MRRFSIIELVVAVAILVFALSATMAITAQAKQRTSDAEERWRKQHYLELATEHFLLCPADDLTIPNGLLPDGVQARCELSAIDDEVDEIGGWTLAEYRVFVEQNGRPLASGRVAKVVRKEDL